jgi:hypothetical protein
MKDKKRMKKIELENKYYGRGSTRRRMQNGAQMAEYERIAKERGVPVARVIAEAIR